MKYPEASPSRQNPLPVALVVDNEPFVLLLLSTVLASKGWHVIQASDGCEALARIEGVELTLLITDFEMPGMDGIELARRVGLRDPKLPVLMVSGRPQQSLALENRPAAFLAKPFRIEDLMGHIAALTGVPPAASYGAAL